MDALLQARKRCAWKVARWARRAGLLKPEPCRDCGQPDPRVLLMHHRNYDNPLAVVWLCRRCHMAERMRVEKLYTPNGSPVRRGYKRMKTHKKNPGPIVA